MYCISINSLHLLAVFIIRLEAIDKKIRRNQGTVIFIADTFNQI